MKYLPLFILFLVMPLVAKAQDNADYTKAQLISATQGTGDLVELNMALDITLKDEWYSYWRMPGDNGVAPVMNWDGSANVKEVKVAWPTPKRFTTLGMHSFGYMGNILFPLQVIPNEPGKDVTLKLKLDIMVCHDICIPQTLTMERKFTAGPAGPSEHASRIAAVIADLPSPSGESSIDTAILGKDAVVVTVSGAPLVEGTDLIIETPNAVLTAPPEIIAPTSEGGSYVLKVKGPEGIDLTEQLFGKQVNILLINGDSAVEKMVSF